MYIYIYVFMYICIYKVFVKDNMSKRKKMFLFISLP